MSCPKMADILVQQSSANLQLGARQNDTCAVTLSNQITSSITW